jgi:hypothetical protein
MSRWRIVLVLAVLLLVLGQPLFTPSERGDRLAIGHDYALAAGQRIDGDLVVLGGDIYLEPGSQVYGSVLALGGSLRVAGQVDGRAMAPSGLVFLEPTAVVAGGILAAGDVARTAGALVSGEITDGFGRGFDPGLMERLPGRCPLAFPGFWFGWPWGVGLAGNLFVWSIQVLLGSLVAVGIGILVALLAPRQTRTAGEALGRYPWQSAGLGLAAWLLAVLVAVPVLVATCIGIPVAAGAVVALTVAALFGCVVAGFVVGERALLALHLAARPPLPAVALGLVILSILASVPYLGMLVVASVGVWGSGAVVLTRFGTTPFRPSPPRLTPRRPR